MMAEQMRATFQDELEQVEAALQEEGDYVLRSLRAAVNALEQADAELAAEMLAGALHVLGVTPKSGETGT